MHWYEKLNQYFPIEEMKSKEHMETLLEDYPDHYHKDESENHLVMYAEFDDFLFIDYLIVSNKVRGQGIGHKVLNKLKEKGKPIILEVEPIDYSDSDTEKRLRFYKREGFKHAQSIGYRRRSLATNEINQMEILYWAPNNEGEEIIYEGMRKTYEKIHTYRDKHFYGESYEPTDKVLTYDEDRDDGDLLNDV